MQQPTQFTLRTTTDVASVSATDWDRLLPDRAEDHAYFRACAAAVPRGFEFSTRTIYRGSELVGLAPMFRTTYPLPIKDLIDKPWAAKLQRNGQPLSLNVELQGIGSPLSDNCPIGLAAGLTDPELAHVTKLLFTPDRRRRALEFIVAKDIPGPLADRLAPHWMANGFARVPTLPTVELTIDVPNIEAFIAARRRSGRNYLKQRNRPNSALTIEHLTAPGPRADEFFALYRAQQSATKVDSGLFDAISPDFMAAVAAERPKGTAIFAYTLGDTLAGFSFNYFTQSRFAAKYVGFRQPLARENSLYVVNFLEAVRFCIARGIPTMDLGQGTYRTKTSFGGQMRRNYLMVRHPSALPNALLKRFSHLLSFEAMDPELEILRAEGIVPT